MLPNVPTKDTFYVVSYKLKQKKKKICNKSYASG